MFKQEPGLKGFELYSPWVPLSVVSIVHQNLHLSTCSKYTLTKLLFRELSAKLFSGRWLSSNVVL